jgi:cell division protein FtsA
MATDIVVGLDIGTTKVTAIVAEIVDDREIYVIGIGEAVSRGLKKGVVVNIEQTTRSVSQAVAEAEKMADVVIDYVYVGVAGAHISSFNSKGVVALGGEDKDIVQADVSRAIEATKTVVIPPNREIIHIIPRSYTVDEEQGIRDPVGMSGIRLEVDCHIVVAAVTSVQNLIKSCGRAHLDVANIVLQPVASAEAVLTDDERELGVCLVDIGGGTTDIAIFHGGSIIHSAVIPVGGSHVTSDVAVGLRTTTARAEELKIKYGSCLADLVDSKKSMEVVNAGGDDSRNVPVATLVDIIGPRTEEMFELVLHEIVRSGCRDFLPAGVVITGGASQLRGIMKTAEEILGLSIRLGKPQRVKGLSEKVDSPKYATGLGLIRYAMINKQAEQLPAEGSSLFGAVLEQMKNWFGDFF